MYLSLIFEEVYASLDKKIIFLLGKEGSRQANLVFIAWSNHLFIRYQFVFIKSHANIT